MKLLTILISILIYSGAAAQSTSCACCTDQYNQFDFWAGEWIVTDTTGTTQLGQNKIVKIQGNCGLQENWQSSGGLTGTSYNYYNPADSSWNQVWIDNQGANLVLKGQANANQMILKSAPIKGQKVEWYYHQVTWTKNANGTVTQQWQVFDGDDNSLGTIFKGIYKPAN